MSGLWIQGDFLSNYGIALSSCRCMDFIFYKVWHSSHSFKIANDPLLNYDSFYHLRTKHMGLIILGIKPGRVFRGGANNSSTVYQAIGKYCIL